MNMHRFSKPAFFIAQAKRLARDELGTTAIEYAMIACGIAVAIVAAVASLGTVVQGMFEKIDTGLK
jgi:pilus assembly protein Flp/PilA